MEGYFTNSALNYSDILYFFEKTPVAEIYICKKCKDNCSSCSSLEYCTSCIPGTYGQTCEHSCDPNCRNTACNSTTGVCENGCSAGYYTNGTTCESCPTCDDCRIDPCKSSCCQATTPPICSVENCDVCSAIDIDLCKDCLDGYRVTGNGTCESTGGELKGNISTCSVKNCNVCSEIDIDVCMNCLDGYNLTKIGTCGSNDGLLTSGSSKGDDDDIETGLAIGSSTFVVTLVAGIVVAILIIVRKRLRQEDLNQTETGEHVYLNDEMNRNSRNTDGSFQNIVGNCGNTDRNSKNIEENSRNINGESRSETRSTSLCNVDIDQHEYENVENPVTGQGKTDYEALNTGVPEEPVSILTCVTDQYPIDYEALNTMPTVEHVYGVTEEAASISTRITGQGKTDDYEALNHVSRDEHVYGVCEEPASIAILVTGREAIDYEALNPMLRDEHTYGMPEEPTLKALSTAEDPWYSN